MQDLKLSLLLCRSKSYFDRKEETPDLIVLDVMLPDGDGFSLMQQLRTFTNVPVIS